MGPSLIDESIVEETPGFDKAALIAGNIIFWHSFSENVHAASGYFNLGLILVCNAVQASIGDGCPILTLAAHSITFYFNTLIHLLVLPSGAIYMLVPKYELYQFIN